MSYTGSGLVPTVDPSQSPMSPESTKYIVDRLHRLEVQEAAYKAVRQQRGSQCPGLQDWKDGLEVARERIEQYNKRLDNLHLQGANLEGDGGESASTTVFGDWSMSDQIYTQSSTHCKYSKRVDSAVDDTPLSPRTRRSTKSSHTETISGKLSVENRIESITEFKTVGRATLYVQLYS
jgi:hypothetical protein